MIQQNRQVLGCLLPHGPLGEPDARAKGFCLISLRADASIVNRISNVLFTFDALVDDAMHAQIAASPDGLLIPIDPDDLPCTFLGELPDGIARGETGDVRPLEEHEAVCCAWTSGWDSGPRQYDGHALYGSFEAVRHHRGSNRTTSEDPGGHNYIFGRIWRVRIDANIRWLLNRKGNRPWWPQLDRGSREPLIPFVFKV